MNPEQNLWVDTKGPGFLEDVAVTHLNMSPKANHKFLCLLARQALYRLSHTLAFVELVIFEIGSHFMPRHTWIAVLLFVLPHIAGWPLHPVTCWDGVLWTFCWGWPRTQILLISASYIGTWDYKLESSCPVWVTYYSRDLFWKVLGLTWGIL
jgi:hypothetical protein